jgi:putative inorganic carbon (HCO3(-)) transporter
VQVVPISRESVATWSASGKGVRVTQVLRGALFLLILGNIGRIPFLDLGDRQAPILLNELAVAAVLLSGALVVSRARSMRLNTVALAAMLFAAIGGLSALAAVPRFGLTLMEVIGSLAYLARWVYYFGIYLVVINCVKADDAESVWAALESALLLIAGFGIVQAIFLPNFAFMVYPETTSAVEWDAQRHRLVSTILEPNVAAAMIVIVLLVQVARLAYGATMPAWKPMLLLGALAMTLSRSGVLAFLAGLFAITVARGLSKRVTRFFALAAVLVVVASPKLIAFARDYQHLGFTDQSALARLGMWRRAIAIFIEHPWFGIGFNTFGFVQERMGFTRSSAATYSSEGGVLFIAVMTGVVGLAVYLTMLWFVLRRCRAGWRDPRSTPHERALFVGSAAATIAVLVHSAFVNSLLVPFVMESLWVLWGLCFLVERQVHQRAHVTVAQQA